MGKEVFWVGGHFLWEVVAQERFKSLSIDWEKSYLGGWSHLVRSDHLQEVLIIEH